MDLKGADRYNEAKLKSLEDLVNEQVSGGLYSLDANLALLRFYQFRTESTSLMLVAKVLCKALMQLPDPDFKLCLHLLPERIQTEEPVATLVLLAGHLEGARFQQFWPATDACKELLSGVPLFFDAIRTYIIHVLQITCQKIPLTILGNCLRLEGAPLTTLLKNKCENSGWRIVTSSGGDIVCFPLNSENQHTQHKVKASSIKFDHIAPMISSLQSTV